jgi:hypothetical protein
MATQKQKEKKKKERERIAHARVVRRREALRAQRKAQLEEERKQQEAHDIVHGKPQPIIKDPAVLAQRAAAQAKAVSEKLKRNLEVLEALEKEYEAEQAARAEINTKLEAEGHKTMREKMDALHQKALAMTGKAEELAQAAEEYAAQHNEEIVVEPNKCEVKASGDVIKGPVQESEKIS